MTTIGRQRGSGALPTRGKNHRPMAVLKSSPGSRPAEHTADSGPCARVQLYKPSGRKAPVRDRITRLAGGAGVEPALTGSKPVVLPLNDPPSMAGGEGVEPSTSWFRATRSAIELSTNASGWGVSKARPRGPQPRALPLSYIPLCFKKSLNNIALHHQVREHLLTDRDDVVASMHPPLILRLVSGRHLLVPHPPTSGDLTTVLQRAEMGIRDADQPTRRLTGASPSIVGEAALTIKESGQPRRLDVSHGPSAARFPSISIHDIGP